MSLFFEQRTPVEQALLATLFTYFCTAVGASLVFFFKNIRKKVLNGMLGFAAGVMIAASYWSLLAPSIELAEQQGHLPWVPAAIGFLAGGCFLYAIDKLLPHLHMGLEVQQAEGVVTSWSRSILLVLAITIHNIPEGLAVGIAFGSLAQGGVTHQSLAGAMILALGIGLQNLPEGAAVATPLRKEGFSRAKSFFYGQLSGIVEPIAGVLGALMVTTLTSILPYALSFAAGAMIYVVVEELIPEAQQSTESGGTDVATIGAMLGFTLMMVLDVGLG